MLQPGDRILVKGSRGMKMETVCAALRSDDGQLAANHS
jgi:UDP-N-acetylmuramoyl-tripeptide--D-alanyl-D-alanine ligase